MTGMHELPDAEAEFAERLVDLGVYVPRAARSAATSKYSNLANTELAAVSPPEARHTAVESMALEAFTPAEPQPSLFDAVKPDEQSGNEENSSAFRLWIIDNTSQEDVGLEELDQLLEGEPAQNGARLAKLAGIAAANAVLRKEAAEGRDNIVARKAAEARAARGINAIHPRG